MEIPHFWWLNLKMPAEPILGCGPGTAGVAQSPPQRIREDRKTWENEELLMGCIHIYIYIWIIDLWGTLWDLWWFMMIYDDLWLFMMIYDDLLWFMMIYGDLWWFMMIYDYLLWLMMIYDDVWLCVMIYDDLW